MEEEGKKKERSNLHNYIGCCQISIKEIKRVKNKRTEGRRTFFQEEANFRLALKVCLPKESEKIKERKKRVKAKGKEKGKE